jgi:hypothetical protein
MRAVRIVLAFLAGLMLAPVTAFASTTASEASGVRAVDLGEQFVAGVARSLTLDARRRTTISRPTPSLPQGEQPPQSGRHTHSRCRALQRVRKLRWLKRRAERLSIEWVSWASPWPESPSTGL